MAVCFIGHLFIVLFSYLIILSRYLELLVCPVQSCLLWHNLPFYMWMSCSSPQYQAIPRIIGEIQPERRYFSGNCTGMPAGTAESVGCSLQETYNLK
jgi:hypothetical protein